MLDVKIFKWSDSYRLGLNVLDEQHHTYFELTNTFWNAVLSGRANDTHIRHILAELTAYTQKHFQEEEALMASLLLPQDELEQHRAAHASFTTRLDEQIARFTGGQGSTAQELVAFMSGWLVQHILEVDVRYARFFHQAQAAEKTVNWSDVRLPPPSTRESSDEFSSVGNIGNIGQYRVLGHLGRGGMGTVFKAVHSALGRLAAVKILAPEMSLRPEQIEHFMHEARLVASLSHPNLVTVYDAGEFRGQHFIAMELVDGPSLAGYIKLHGPLGEARLLSFMRQAALGLSIAHAKGLVHRDIKPENLLLEQEQTVRLVDFGIAMDQQSLASASERGALVGTPQYMSPEQSDGQPLDARSDLYSMGATFYQAATGKIPLEATSLHGQLYLNKHAVPDAPKTHRPELSESTNHLLLWLLRKRPEDRVQSAGALIELIDRIASGESIQPSTH